MIRSSRRSLIVAAVLAMLSVSITAGPASAACSGGTGSLTRTGYWAFNAQAGVNLIGAKSEMRIIKPYIPAGGADSEIFLYIWDTTTGAWARVGYTVNSAGARTGWAGIGGNSTTFTISDALGSWQEFKLVKSGGTWYFYYKGALVHQAASPYGGNRAEIQVKTREANSQFWGRVTYHWSTRNSTYTSQYGTGGFGIASVNMSQAPYPAQMQENANSELEAWDASCP